MSLGRDDKPIHLFVPTFDVEACLAQVRDALERGWTGLGDKTVSFERAWQLYTDRSHVHFLNSATAGLHLAVKLLGERDGWEPGDEIITTALTFVSTNHAILYEEYAPVFADVDDSGSLDCASVEKMISPRTRAVLFVGLGGNVGQLAQIAELCRSRKLVLIVDAAHMAGTKMRGGNDATFDADAVAYSFQAVKTLPTGDAGAVSFKDPSLDRRAREVSWLGITRDTYSRTLQPGTYRWEYDVSSVGYKYNGNSIMAGIALAQLPHLDSNNAHRRMICDEYDDLLISMKNVRTVAHSDTCRSSRHLYQIIVSNVDRNNVMARMNALNVFPGVHYKSNTLYSPYAQCRGANNLKRTMEFSSNSISLPLHLRMSFDDVGRVVNVLREVVAQ